MLVRKKTYNELSDKYDGVLNQLTDLLANQERMNSIIGDLEGEIESYNQRINEIADENKSLRSSLDKQGNHDSNQVTLEIADDLTTVTPYVRWKENTPEGLIQAGMINDVDVEKSTTATQLALMTIAHEVLDEIIESFSEPIKE